MDINDLSNKVLFLEDLKSLYGAGSVSSPKQVILSTEDVVDDVTVTEVILDETYYGDFDGLINLDYRDVVTRQIVPVIPDVNTAPLPPEDSGGYRDLSLNFGDTVKKFTVNGFSADAKSRISDLDFLLIPADSAVILNVYAGWSSYVISLETGGRTEALLERADLKSDGKGYYSYLMDVSVLRVGKNPFRFSISAVNDELPHILKTGIYQCSEGHFEEYLFSGRLGGYVYFPMQGALELSTEYEFEIAKYQTRSSKAYGQGEPLLKQYTGGLTMTAAAVLSELLLSDSVLHRSGGTWHPIVMDTPEITFRNIDSLHYGNFSFRYAEETALRSVIPGF